MPRRPRIHCPGALYHVLLRGSAGQDIFFEDADRYRLYPLQEGVERFGHRIHAFCLMSNHLHLAVQVGDVPLSRIMQNLSFRYTRWINMRQNRTGHLFQGRFKALLIDADSYLLELVRYIHLNPVRSAIVSAPGDYPWTSQRAYLGMETLPWLETDWILSSSAERKDKARRLYREFIMDGLAEGHRKEFHSGSFDGRILGDNSFAGYLNPVMQSRIPPACSSPGSRRNREREAAVVAAAEALNTILRKGADTWFHDTTSSGTRPICVMS